MTVNEATPPSTADSAPSSAAAPLPWLVYFAKKLWADPETVLPRPLGWWRAL